MNMTTRGSGSPALVIVKIFAMLAALATAASTGHSQVTSTCIGNVTQYKTDSITISKYAASTRVTMEKRLLANVLEACNSAGAQRSFTTVLADLQRLVKKDTVVVQVPGPTLYCTNGVCSTSPPVVVTPPPPPPPSGSSPVPCSTCTILIDTRAGGAHSIQSANTMSEAMAQIAKANRAGADPLIEFTTNVDGNNTRAFRFLWRATPVGNDVNQRIEPYLNEPTNKATTRLFVQWKHRMGRTVTGGGIGNLGEFFLHNPGELNSGRKMLLLCRFNPADPGSCGARVDQTWSGEITKVGVEGFYGISGASNLECNVTPYFPQAHVGETITVTQYFQAESTSGARNGVIRLWFNDALCMDHANVVTGTEAIGRFQFPSVIRSPYRDGTEYFWDLLVWRP